MGIGFARESITEREFSECVPAVRWNFFAGPPIHIEGKGITFPRRLNLYSRRQGVNRPLRIVFRGQIRFGSSGEAIQLAAR
jgi:hypothetical protein